MSAETVRTAPVLMDGLAVPAGIAPLVRGRTHYELILRALGGSRMTHKYGGNVWEVGGPKFRAAQQAFRLLIEGGTGDERVTPLITYLFPPQPCSECGRPFLSESARRLHCSDRCRRRASGRGLDEYGRYRLDALHRGEKPMQLADYRVAATERGKEARRAVPSA